MTVIIKKKDSIQERAIQRFKRKKIALLLDSVMEDKPSLEQEQWKVVYSNISNIPDTKITVCNSFEDVKKHYMLKKSVLLLVNYDIIEDRTKLFDFLIHLKELKNIPFIFFATSPEELVLKYRENLFIYQEADDFVTFPLTLPILKQKISKALSGRFRKTKRFNLFDAVMYSLPMQAEEKFEGSIMDLSLEGFYLRTRKEVFKSSDQIQLHIPLSKYGLFNIKYGEILKVAGQVKRVNISGNEAGCEIVHLEEAQKMVLINIINQISTKKTIKKKKLDAVQKALDEKAS